MKTEQYTVLTAGFIEGKHREVGETFPSTERAMRYARLHGQVETDDDRKKRLAKEAEAKKTTTAAKTSNTGKDKVTK